MRRNRFYVYIFLLLPFITACLPAFSASPPPPVPTRMAVATVPLVPTWTPRPTVFIPPTHTPPATVPPPATAVPSPTVSPTPDPYAGLTVADLRARSYGGGLLQVEEVLDETPLFTRYLITYPSDELTIYGFMNVPKSVSGPLPVVLVLHGYVNPEQYNTKAYTTAHADALAAAGYLVIHPNYRGYPPSDTGDNDLRIGYAVDVLNLMALVQQQGGRSGPLQPADPNDVSLWGHSMGGGIALRVLVVSEDVRAAVLYGSMSGDEYKNYERIFDWTNGRSGQEELAIPPAEMARIAPINFLADVTAAVSIHHGTADGQVPFAWSVELCDALRALGKEVTCYTYDGQPHYFGGDTDALFRQRVLDFLGE